MSRFSIALADKSAAGAMDPVRIVVKRIHFHTQKPVLQTLPAKHRVDAAGKRIKVIGSGLVKLKSLKRFAASAGFKAAKCGCLALLLVFAFDVKAVSSPLPVCRAEMPAGKNAGNETGNENKQFGGNDIPQDIQKCIHDLISIFLFMFGMYCGYKIVSLHWKIKFADRRKSV